MGWTSLHREPGMTDREFFEKEFPETLTRQGGIVECASVNFTWYAAVRDFKTGEVWGFVVLMRRSRDYFNFTYKDLTETMGPVECNAPAKVLDALTPTDSEYALQWRKACRDRLAQRAAARQLKPGTLIEFGHSMSFTNGCEYSAFEFLGRNRFRAAGTGVTVRISNWRDRTWAVAST